jgi:hypothetical protein
VTLLWVQSQWDKPADVDLPPESLTAAPDQITLPDNIYDDVFAGAGLSMDLCAASSSGCPDLVVQHGRPLYTCQSWSCTLRKLFCKAAQRQAGVTHSACLQLGPEPAGHAGI